MPKDSFAVVKRDDLLPICPHCEAELPEVHARSSGAPFVQGHNVIYFCPHCRKVLGAGQSRMI